MKPLLVTVLVLCAVAAGVGTVVRPGIPEIAIVVCVALASFVGLRTLHRNERLGRPLRLDNMALAAGSSNRIPTESEKQNPYASPQCPE